MAQSLSDLTKGIHSCSALETEQMLHLYQEYIRQKLNVYSVSWIAAYQGDYGRELWKTEILNGWKVMEIIYPPALNNDSKVIESEYFRLIKENGIDPLARYSIEHAGKTRVHDHKMKDDEWIKKDFLSKRNIGHRMYGIFHLDEQAESYVVVDRLQDAEPFTKEDEKLLYDALLAFPRLHYWLFLERGLVNPAQRPFTPRQRELIKLMLTPLSEKEIAKKLKLAIGTTHNYISKIYQNLSVNSRAEMMQLWFAAVPG
jgi:DNA-binding CsgD family transcriptional regulator